VARTAFRAAPYTVGLRANDYEVVRLLEASLASAIVADASAPATYSVHRRVSRRDPDRARFRISRGCRLLATTTSPARMIAIVRGHLSAHMDGPPRRGRLRLEQQAWLGPRGVVLAPWTAGWGGFEAELEDRGIHQLERRFVDIDVEAGAAVVGSWALLLSDGRSAHDLSVKAVTAASSSPGAYPLLGWLVPGAGAEGQARAALAVAQNIATARNNPQNPEDAWEGLKALAYRTELIALRDEHWGKALARSTLVRLLT
jgi:hypothetical protein